MWSELENKGDRQGLEVRVIIALHVGVQRPECSERVHRHVRSYRENVPAVYGVSRACEKSNSIV
jgi:hypothetical protein